MDRPTKEVEGRLRPFPAKPAIGPAFTPGGGLHPNPYYHLSARFTGLRPAGYRRGSRVNAADKEAALAAEPGVNAGPNTAFGGKAR